VNRHGVEFAARYPVEDAFPVCAEDLCGCLNTHEPGRAGVVVVGHKQHVPTDPSASNAPYENYRAEPTDTDWTRADRGPAQLRPSGRPCLRPQERLHDIGVLSRLAHPQDGEMLGLDAFL
jgi:hypothetical protein